MTMTNDVEALPTGKLKGYATKVWVNFKKRKRRCTCSYFKETYLANFPKNKMIGIVRVLVKTSFHLHPFYPPSTLNPLNMKTQKK